MKEWRLASSEEINNMTFDEAKEIIKRMIDLGHKTGDFRPREHFTRAMEIILEKAEANNKTKHKWCLFCANSMSADAPDGTQVLVCFNCHGMENKEIIVDEDGYCRNYNE